MNTRLCRDCKYFKTNGYTEPCSSCDLVLTPHFERQEKVDKISISFPILNNLTPTVPSCTNKLIEELGELLQIIGKGQGQSGEKLGVKEQSYLATNMIAEAFDVAQSAVTMAHTLATEYDIDLVGMMEAHTMKLRERGYLK